MNCTMRLEPGRLRINREPVPGNDEAEPCKLSANQLELAVNNDKVSVIGVPRFAVDVDSKAADQAPRLAQALKQLDGCLEVIPAAAQGQVVYFAGCHFSGLFVGYCPHRAFNHFIG